MIQDLVILTVLTTICARYAGGRGHSHEQSGSKCLCTGSDAGGQMMTSAKQETPKVQENGQILISALSWEVEAAVLRRGILSWAGPLKECTGQ